MRSFLTLMEKGPVSYFYQSSLSRCFLLYLIGILLLSSFPACSKPYKGPLRIGINTWPGYEFLYLAKLKGYYEEEGVDIQMVEYSSLEDTLTAFSLGKIDIMTGTLIEALMASEIRRIMPKVFMVVDYSNGADQIIAHSSIRSIADLRGKRIAVETTSLTFYMLVRALQLHGMTLDDIEYVRLDQANMADAFESGLVDAIVAFPPVSINALSQPDSHTLFTSADIPGEVVDVVFADRSIMADHNDDIQGIIRAWARAKEYAREQPEEAYTLMGNRMGLNSEEFKKSLEGIELVGPEGQEAFLRDPDKLMPTVDRIAGLLKKLEILTYPGPYDILPEDTPAVAD